MCAALVLEEFTALLPGGEAPADEAPACPPAGAGAQERLHTEVWEQGYKAGWEDALRNEADEQQRISTELARSLQEMTFGYFEARAEVVASLEPLLKQMAEAVFPPLAAEAVSAALHEQLEQVLESGEDAVELVLSPAGRAAVESRLGEALPPAVRLVEEDTVADCQAYLRMPRSERLIDVGAALEAVRAAIDAFFAQHGEREVVNG
ncbi:MAG: flagellar biosynthesis protein [Alphaproteobacteria bacterium]|nr:MAG: flagellar biosynthesis protein [Alphaproteobacteria bacterium]